MKLALHAFQKHHLANHVRVVRDGAEALEFVFCTGRYADRQIENGPKVILLDLKLPLVDGLDVLRRIKGDPRTRAIPVVVMTSSREEGDVVESYKLGREQLHRQAGGLRAVHRGGAAARATTGCC